QLQHRGMRRLGSRLRAWAIFRSSFRPNSTAAQRRTVLRIRWAQTTTAPTARTPTTRLRPLPPLRPPHPNPPTPPPPPSPPRPPPPPGPQAQVPQLSGRTFSRGRIAPERVELTAIKVTDHVNGLLGGLAMGAGLGFGLELTTAKGSELKGFELYARAMGSTR